MASKNDLSKLYRSENNKVIAGVCGGLGEYFDIDPVILRIILVLITIFGGSGLLIYIILWIVIPSKSTLGKKSEDYIKENVEEIKTKSQDAVKNGNGRIFGGVLLVLLGASFLLENLGFYVFHNIWKFWQNLFSYWPVLIIFVGIDVIFGKSTLGNIIAGVINSVIFLLIVAKVTGFSLPFVNPIPLPRKN